MNCEIFTDAQSTRNCSLEVGHSKEPGNDNLFVKFLNGKAKIEREKNHQKNIVDRLMYSKCD